MYLNTKPEVAQTETPAAAACQSAASPDGPRLVNTNVLVPHVAALDPQPAFLNRVHAFDELWYSTLDTLRPLVFQASARPG